VASENQAQRHEKQSRSKLNPALAVDDEPVDVNRGDHAGQSENQACIGDNGPHGIAQRQPGFALKRGQHRHRRFRRRRAETDDGGPDDHLGKARPFGQNHRLVHQNVGAFPQTGQHERDEQKKKRPVNGRDRSDQILNPHVHVASSDESKTPQSWGFTADV
jgi:hypothetical protein